MVENNKGSRGPESGLEAEAALVQGDKQATLLKLAERTVLQAEALAQEITDHATKESEAEGLKIVAQYTEQAKAEAQQIIESAQSRSETILTNASADARTDSEKVLTKAQSESEKLLSKAQSESEKLLSKAQSEKEEGLSQAQTEAQEILGRAQQDAQAIINAAQVRAESTESKARLKAEFIVRQTTQNVADGIRTAVLETCNNLLQTLEEFGKEAKGAPVTDPIDQALPDEAVAFSPIVEESSAAPEPAQSADTESMSIRNGGKSKKNAIA